VQRLLRFALIATVVLLVLPVANVRAVARMPIGFYDDPSLRWANRLQIPKNLADAQKANATIIHVLADWSQIAPTKPKRPLSGDDPAYNLTDLDSLVETVPRYNLSILLTISGVPKWANGGQTPNHPPRNLQNLTDFAHMLAARYNGRRGFGAVRRWSVWNEPNLEQFLTPQYRGNKIVSPAAYAKIYMAAYKGIKAGNTRALVAAGETSNRGRNKPSVGVQDSVAPATFARLVAEANPKLPIAAWAEHPYPTVYALGPNQKVAYPNVGLSNIDRFGVDLQKWFHKRVPIWVTEWGEQTKPEYAFGVPYLKQAADVRTALQLAADSPYVEMFTWFIFRDSTSKTWFSGIEKRSGAKKPAYPAFTAAAKPIAGTTQTVAANRPFTVKVDVPFMAYRNIPGQVVGVTYRVFLGRSVAAIGQPQAPIQPDQTISFKVNFKPAKASSYTLTADVNDRHGQHETLRMLIQTPGVPTTLGATTGANTGTSTTQSKKASRR
jgi:glycosyl hydrolase family 39 (putative alpha-L-iduronidase)